MLTVLILVFSLKFYILLEDHLPTAKFRLGIFCCSITVIYCSAPLASLQHVCRERTTASLPFYLILATMLVAAQWTLYGALISDLFVLIPNLLGCLVALFQLVLFCVFSDKCRGGHGEYTEVGQDL